LNKKRRANRENDDEGSTTNLDNNLTNVSELSDLIKIDTNSDRNSTRFLRALRSSIPKTNTRLGSLQPKNLLVGMTGDHANHHPTLRQAEAGIAVCNVDDLTNAAVCHIRKR